MLNIYLIYLTPFVIQPPHLPLLLSPFTHNLTSPLLNPSHSPFPKGTYIFLFGHNQ